MLTKKVPKSSENFYCNFCDYETSRKSQYNRHLMTAKHYKLTKVNQKSSESSENNNLNFICSNCNFEYKSRVGLWKHKKICCIKENKIISKSDLTNNVNENEIVNFLMKENSEFKQLLIEQNKQLIELSNKIGNTVFNTINNSNSHNKTFNLNMFLNETCKNAMNISDFADSIKLELSDLESVGELGYINGISNIIIKNLKELDITQRPIHCTDAKRETLYIKDKDKWEKEGEQKEIIVKFVTNIANKNIRMLSEFKKRYPDCCKYESKYSDYYSKLIIEAMGGSGGTDAEKHEKIIRKICKEVIVDKSNL
jgi:hypothetical protein